MFAKGSRYENTLENEITDASGRVIRYKTTRFIPPTPAQVGHIISADERLDHIAFFYYRDPERFWRICDANLTLFPDDLAAEVGRKIGVPAAEEKR
jgi:hypothetical protein